MRILELLAQVVGSDKRYDKQYAKCYIANICGNHFFSGEAFGLLPPYGKGLHGYLGIARTSGRSCETK